MVISIQQEHPQKTIRVLLVARYGLNTEKQHLMAIPHLSRQNHPQARLVRVYTISNNSWEQLTDTPHAQGAGDAITWSGYDDQICALLGSKGHGTAFACYNISTNSWNAFSFNPSWTVIDDGASLVWTGGEYLWRR